MNDHFSADYTIGLPTWEPTPHRSTLSSTNYLIPHSRYLPNTTMARKMDFNNGRPTENRTVECTHCGSLLRESEVDNHDCPST